MTASGRNKSWTATWPSENATCLRLPSSWGQHHDLRAIQAARCKHRCPVLCLSSVLLLHASRMNCPSRNDDTDKHPHWNQNPPALTADLTSRADLNGIANIREHEYGEDMRLPEGDEDRPTRGADASGAAQRGCAAPKLPPEKHASTTSNDLTQRISGRRAFCDVVSGRARRVQATLSKYAQFIGPGFLIAVAYIDPGNYATDVNGMQ